MFLNKKKTTEELRFKLKSRLYSHYLKHELGREIEMQPMFQTICLLEKTVFAPKLIIRSLKKKTPQMKIERKRERERERES